MAAGHEQSTYFYTSMVSGENSCQERPLRFCRVKTPQHLKAPYMNIPSKPMKSASHDICFLESILSQSSPMKTQQLVFIPN